MDEFDVVITTFLRFSNVLCYFLMAHIMRMKKDLFCYLGWYGGPNMFLFIQVSDVFSSRAFIYEIVNMFVKYLPIRVTLVVEFQI